VLWLGIGTLVYTSGRRPLAADRRAVQTRPEGTHIRMSALGARFSSVALVALLLLACSTTTGRDGGAPGPPPSGFVAEAVALRAYTSARLAHYGGADACATAPFVSYARSNEDASVADAWYVALQVSADADLVRLGAAEYRCAMDKALAYLERLWVPDGGYAPRAALDATTPSPDEKFADDNALIGLTYLDAAEATLDPATRARYVAAACRVAAYVRQTYWDDTFGGGLWWSTRQAAAREGKPAQANALAAALFLRLHALTGDPTVRAWADETLAWLDTTLWDDDAGLYRWAVHYADRAAHAGQAVSPYYFNYDQGLLIEAHLLRYQADGQPTAELARAQRIAAALDETFWDARRPGYSLRSGVVWIYPTFAAWLTPPLVALYRVDADARWLEMARRNVEALAATMRDAEDGGYFDYAWDCTRWTTRRERWVMSSAKPGGAQAAVQRALAALAGAAAPGAPRSVALVAPTH
jgi:uncharacterized protein YyaL (SSP411 family)